MHDFVSQTLYFSPRNIAVFVSEFTIKFCCKFSDLTEIENVCIANQCIVLKIGIFNVLTIPKYFSI